MSVSVVGVWTGQMAVYQPASFTIRHADLAADMFLDSRVNDTLLILADGGSNCAFLAGFSDSSENSSVLRVDHLSVNVNGALNVQNAASFGSDIIGHGFSNVGGVTYLSSIVGSMSQACTVPYACLTGVPASTGGTSSGPSDWVAGSAFSAGATTVAALTAAATTLASLTVSGATALFSLAAAATSLTTLAVTGATALTGALTAGVSTFTSIGAGPTSVTTLNAAGPSTLASLNAGATIVTTLAAGATTVAALTAAATNVASLAVSGATSLGTLAAGPTTVSGFTAGATTLTTLLVTGASALTTLSAGATTVGTLSAGATVVAGLSAAATSVTTLSAGATTVAALTAAATNVTTLAASSVTISGALSKGSGSFVIDHPDVRKRREGYRLKHCFVESPTRGDNLYRYTVVTHSLVATISLPGYFPFLNEDVQAWVGAVDVLGVGRCILSDDCTQAVVNVSIDGTYSVLIVGTRKDDLARRHFEGEGGAEFIPQTGR